MSRIFVIEPYKMLQQAFVAALFPEHQVQVSERIPDASVDLDMVIIDAAAMRRGDLMTARDLERIQTWKIPIIWIDDELVARGVPIANAVRLAAPIARDELRTAVAESLRALPAPQRATTRKTARIESEPPRVALGDKQVIELVEVFEEAPERGDGGAEARNKD